MIKLINIHEQECGLAYVLVPKTLEKNNWQIIYTNFTWGQFTLQNEYGKKVLV